MLAMAREAPLPILFIPWRNIPTERSERKRCLALRVRLRRAAFIGATVIKEPQHHHSPEDQGAARELDGGESFAEEDEGEGGGENRLERDDEARDAGR